MRQTSVHRRAVGPIPLAVPLLVATMLAACDSPTEPTGPATDVVDEHRQGGILFTASAVTVGDHEIEVALTAMNETNFDTQTAISGGNCMLMPRLYDQRGGRLAWSYFDEVDGCQEVLRLFQLGGGVSGTVTGRFDVGVGDGAYFVTVTISASGLDAVELAAGTVTIH